MISSCFQDVLKNLRGKASQQKCSVPLSRQANRSSQQSVGSNGNISHDSTEKSKTSLKRKPSSNRDRSDSGSDSDDDDSRTERTRGKVKRKHRMTLLRNSTDLHSQKVDSDTDDDDIDLLLGSLHKEHKKTSGYDLCTLVLNLLQDLTLSDIEQMSPVKYLSPSILPDLLTTLSNMDVEVNERVKDTEAFIEIKRHILQVVLTCCGIIAAQQNGVNILIGHKVVETLLCLGQTLELTDLQPSREILENKVLFSKVNLLSDIVVGLLLCLTVVFECLPFNPTFIQSARRLMEEFDLNDGFKNLRKIFWIADWLKSNSDKLDWLDDDPVKIFGNFLNTIKVVRVNYIHSMKCVKRKHQKCSYSEYFDHHHDILGVPASQNPRPVADESLQIKSRSLSQSSQTLQTQPSVQTVCIVAVCTDVLLSVLKLADSKSMRLDILRVIFFSGVCCCMNLEEIIKTFVATVERFSPAVRGYALESMNKIILEHFSGGLGLRLKDQVLSCTYCEATSDSNITDASVNMYAYFHKPVMDTEFPGLDSGFSSSDLQKTNILSAVYKLSKYRAVHQLRKLLYSDNEALAISIAKYLLVLAIKGNSVLKAELFFGLYMKTLRSFGRKDVQCGKSSHKGEMPLDSSPIIQEQLSKTVQVHCLSALPYLLQANCVTKAFLAQQGVLKMCQLLEDGILRIPVLRVFEALIVLDEEKLDEGNDLGNSDACPHPYKGGSVVGAFLEELSKRSFCTEVEDDDLEATDSGRKTSSRKRVRHDSVVCNRFSLPVLVDLWETCAKLSLHNHVFVSQFLSLECLGKTEGLLLETLEVLVSSCVMVVKSQASTETEDSGLEGDHIPIHGGRSEGNAFCMRVTLMESLVVVIGACCQHLEQEVNYKLEFRLQKEVGRGVQGSHRLEKYLNLEGLLEKSLKIKSALKMLENHLKALKSP